MEQWGVSIRIQVSNKNIEETTLLEKNYFGKIKLPKYGVYSKFANIANIKEEYWRQQHYLWREKKGKIKLPKFRVYSYLAKPTKNKK